MLVHTGTPSLHFVSTPTTSSNSTRPIMQSPSFAVPPPSPPTAEVPAQLDEIWGRDLTKISLPDYVKSNSTSLSFPEKLMLMLVHMEQSFSKSGKKMDDAPISWTLEGRAFVIRNRDDLVQTWLPLFFRHGKFQSFTRKLYRWGFRQVNLPREDSQEKRDLVFASPHFHRNKRELMVHMKSVTAASLRREKEQSNNNSEVKITSTLHGSMLPQDLTSLGLAHFQNLASAVAGPSHHPPLAHANLRSLSHLSGMGALGEGTLLDPLTRQLLLNRERMERGPSLIDLYRQAQLVEQLRAPPTSSLPLNLRSSDLPQPLGSLGQAPINPGFLESLITAATNPSTAPQGSFGRSDVLHGSLLEVVQQLVRDSSTTSGSNTSSPPPSPKK